MTINILVVLDRSANNVGLYEYQNVLQKHDINMTIIEMNILHKFIRKNDISIYQLLIYQTFPVEQHHKFNKVQNDFGDKFFTSFPNKKLLFDTHDDGNIDGFPRFDNLYDRIKTTVGYDIIDKLKVKFVIGDPVYTLMPTKFNKSPKIMFSYNVFYQTHGYGHFIREQTRDIILNSRFKSVTDTNTHLDFENHLSNCRVSICPPGCCGCYEMYSTNCDTSKYTKISGSTVIKSGISRRQLFTLKQGALLLAYASFSNLKLFNKLDLIENEDYLTYTLDNLEDKMRYCVDNIMKIDKIRKSGQCKFQNATEIESLSMDFKNFIEKYIE